MPQATRGCGQHLHTRCICCACCVLRVLCAAQVRRVLVYEDASLPREQVAVQAGRDVWWLDEVPRRPTYCAPEWMDSEDRLFLLYTSGSTGERRRPPRRHRTQQQPRAAHLPQAVSHATRGACTSMPAACLTTKRAWLQIVGACRTRGVDTLPACPWCGARWRRQAQGRGAHDGRLHGGHLADLPLHV